MKRKIMILFLIVKGRRCTERPDLTCGFSYEKETKPSVAKARKDD